MEELKKISSELPELIEIKSTPIQIEENKQHLKIIKSKKANDKKEMPAVKPKESLEILLEKNIKLSEAIFAQNKKIKNRLTMMMVGNYVKLLLIIIPLIIAFIYLPPLLTPLLSQYNELLGGTNTMDFSNILKTLNSQDAIKIQEALKNMPK